MKESFFEILGVPRRYHLAAADLERAFHERSRALHPDKHMKADGSTRIKTALAASNVNEAYRALKDRIKRAEYLLSLSNIHLTDERTGHKVAPAFLMEIMELREALMEAKAEGNAAAVEDLAKGVRVRRAEVIAKMESGNYFKSK